MQDAQDAPQSKIHVKATPLGLPAKWSHAKGPSDKSPYQPSDEDIQKAVEFFPAMISSGLMKTKNRNPKWRPKHIHKEYYAFVKITWQSNGITPPHFAQASSYSRRMFCFQDRQGVRPVIAAFRLPAVFFAFQSKCS